MSSMKPFLKYILLAALIAANCPVIAQTVGGSSQGQAAPGQSAKLEKLADGIVVPLKDTFLKVEVYGDNVVRIACAKDRAFFARKSAITEPKRAVKTDWSLKTGNGEAILSTASLQVHVNLATGAVSFFDANGKLILAEKADGRTLTPAEVQGEQTFHVRQQWEPNADESLYGLGQRQIGILDIKGWDLDLWQHNTHVVVPFLVSSRGYGVLWDNLSFTRFGDLREFESIPADRLVDASGQPGGLTTGTFTMANPDQLENARATNEIAVVPNNRGGARRWIAVGGRNRPAYNRRLSIQDLLERPHQNVAGRKGCHRTLAAGLADGERSNQSPADSRASLSHQARIWRRRCDDDGVDVEDPRRRTTARRCGPRLPTARIIILSMARRSTRSSPVTAN